MMTAHQLQATMTMHSVDIRG